MNRIILYIITLLLFGCGNVPHKDLLGYWKSDEKKTLESMNSKPEITEKAKEVFKNDFFGKFIVEYKIDTYRARFEKKEENIEEFDQFYPYKVIDITDEYYFLESYDLLQDTIEKKKIYKDGDCHFVLISKWEFREYFCRIQ